jgi:hypothetical protein
MKFLKHSLVMVVLLAAIMPCSHAAGHHDHDHDAIMELCAFSTDPCECHSCDHQPCSDDAKIQNDRTLVSKTIELSTTPALRFPMPKYQPTIRQTLSPVSGILASIQTVQLLI